MHRLPNHPIGDKGTYILILRLKRSQSITVGRLGGRRFPAGYYAYAGSALGPGGLTARLKHHMTIADRPRWHVDYLRRVAGLHAVWMLEMNNRREHQWAGVLGQMTGAKPVPGFGCSDCRCPAHLFYFKKCPDIRRFVRKLPSLFPDDPPVRQRSLANV